MTDHLRILGIDPGSRVTGFGVLDCEQDRAIYVASGAVKTADGAFADRLKLIFRSVSEIVSEYRPQVMSIESVFVHRNAGSALKLGHARSAAICASFEFDLDVHEYAPREIKQAIVGSGSASKEQVIHMIRAILELDGNPSADAADALAVALCHANQRRMQATIRAHKATAGGR
ncbi:MAG: crossover junction endodeoxyribonuclease RuvC [Hyphomicrobiales bacterium]